MTAGPSGRNAATLAIVLVRRNLMESPAFGSAMSAWCSRANRMMPAIIRRAFSGASTGRNML